MKYIHLFESFNSNNDLHKFYLIPHSDKFSFSHIDSLVRSVSAELFMLLMPPGIFPDSIHTEIPVFNYGNQPELQGLIDSGVVKKENVYNLPENLVNANSKVEFHKKTEGLDFVPTTVFTLEEATKLKFPIIAKPSGGSKGEGIEVLKTKEDLEKSENKFDVFSEKFDLKREFRIISVKGEIVFAAERIPENDKANSLREEETKNQHQNKDIFDREGTLAERSSYKWVKIDFGKDLPAKEKFASICKQINDSLELEFLGVDIGLDGSGKLWCIEANTCPGLNKDQIVLIYLALFKDFYKRDPDENTMKLINHYKDELMRANEDPAKFSFSPHQGNRFYYYNDKVDNETGERKGRALLTTKYNIEKSFGDTMLNIKKANEMRILNFDQFINENEDDHALMANVELKLKQLVDGRLKPKVEIKKFDFPDDIEQETKDEELNLDFDDNEESITIDCTWTYTYKKGKFSSETGPDSDDIDNGDVEVNNIIFFIDGKDQHVGITPNMKKFATEYVKQFVPA